LDVRTDGQAESHFADDGITARKLDPGRINEWLGTDGEGVFSCCRSLGVFWPFEGQRPESYIGYALGEKPVEDGLGWVAASIHTMKQGEAMWTGDQVCPGIDSEKGIHEVQLAEHSSA
jgi:hypothetical protein